MRAPKKILGAIAGISMLATTLGIGSAAFAASPTYYDIYDLTTLAQTAANGLFQAGIMNGTAPGKFSPDGVVTRAQAVKFVVNLSGVHLEYPKTPSYSDVSASSQYYAYIETALQDGFLTGYAGSSGAFDPSTPVTRVQLAILTINAMGDQSVAQSMATDSTTYFGTGKLKDLAKVPSGDLGYANAGMKLGFVPPLNGSLYFPNGKVNREQLAVGLWRAYEALQASAPASAAITATPMTVGVGQASTLTTVVKNKAGTTLTAAQLAGYTLTYSVTGTNASSATVSSNGIFVATASGNYTVGVSISGGLLSAPVTATGTVGVYGTAVALQIKPASATVEADGAAVDTITVNAVDANGNVVGNYSGQISITDTQSLIGSATTVVGQPSDFTQTAGNAGTLTLSNGTGTFSIGGTTFAGLTDSLTATQAGTSLTAGTATVTTAAPTASALSLSIASGFPATLSANTQVYTEVQVAFVDASGTTLSSGVGQYVTLTLAGPGSFVAGTTPVTTYSVFDNGTVDVPVYSEAGQPGTIVVSGTSSGKLTATPLNIPTYINTTPASLGVTTTTGTDASGNAYTEYTVTLNDTNGHPIIPAVGTNGTLTVTDNAAVGGGTLLYSTNGTTFSTSAAFPVAFGANGVATFYVETQTVGSGSVTLTIAGSSGTANGFSTTAPYSYVAGVASTVALSPDTATVLPGTAFNVVGGTNLTITAQVEDSHGNAVSGAGQSVTFAFASDGAGVTFPNGLAGANTYTVATAANGVASLTLAMPANPGATPTFQLKASLGTSISATVDHTPVITIAASTNTGAITTQLVPSTSSYPTPPATLTAGNTLSGLTVTAENAVGTGVQGDTLSFSSSNSNVIPAPANVTTGLNGIATIPNITAGMAGTAVLTVTDLSVVSQPKTQIAITVSPGTAATQEVIEYNGSPISASNPVTVNANTPVQLTVVNTDGAYDPIPVTGSTGITVNLAVAGVSGGFLSAPGGAPITSVTINPGQSSVIVYFESATAETLTGGLTATAAAVGAPTISSVTETSTGETVVWGAVSGAQSYTVLESPNTGTYTTVATGVTSTTYAATGLTAGTSYTFEVQSVVGGAASAASAASTALEWGTHATGAANTAFSPNTATAPGSATFTVTMSKTLATQTPSAANFTVTDTTGSITYTVTSVSVSGTTVTINTTIPAGTVAAAADSVTITATAGALTDAAGAPSAAVSQTTTN